MTQAILEFEEGNQGLLGHMEPELAGQLGDGSIGQLGHPDPENPAAHAMLQGEYT